MNVAKFQSLNYQKIIISANLLCNNSINLSKILFLVAKRPWNLPNSYFSSIILPLVAQLSKVKFAHLSSNHLSLFSPDNCFICNSIYCQQKQSEKLIQ